MLRVWLPLTKDLRQQGLASVTVTNNGATFNSAGKLGGAYEFASGKRIQTTLPSTSNLNSKAISFACWMYITSWNSSYDCFMSIADGTGWNQSRATLCRNNTASTLTWNIADGTNRAYVNTTTALSLNTWTHVACTYDGSSLKIYINGVLNNTAAATLSIGYAGTFNVGGWSGANYPFNGRLNDVRIYSHCLSPMEVKELAKGLVLHYPLNRQGWGQENQLKNSNFSNGTNSWYSVNSSSIRVETKDGYTCGIGTKGTSSYVIGQTSAAYTGGTTIDITVSARVYVTEAGTLSVSHWITTTQASGWQNMSGSRVWNTTNSLSVGWNYISTTLKNATNQYTGNIVTAFGYTGTTFWITNVKLEFGNKATPWCPNSADELATTMGLNSTTEYDCSGFCNNGNKGGNTITYTSDTPKYAVSTQLTGTTVDTTSNTKTGAAYITGSCSLSNITALTVSWWAKIKQYGRGGIMDLTAVTSNYEEGTDYNTCPLSNWDSTFRLWDGTNAFNFFSYVLKDSTWHHYVITFTSGSGKFYRDGVNVANSGTMGNTLTNFNGIRTGLGKAGGVYRQIKEDISDIRIYVTALSASDVKSLYQNSAYIDSSGNVYGAVHSEV